jgi:hypothetical protein
MSIPMGRLPFTKNRQKLTKGPARIAPGLFFCGKAKRQSCTPGAAGARDLHGPLNAPSPAMNGGRWARMIVQKTRVEKAGERSPVNMTLGMVQEKTILPDLPGSLAQRLPETLLRERIVPRFVDNYVLDNGRHALQVHAALYRDLLNLLQREGLLAICARSLDVVCNEPPPIGKAKPRPMLRKDAAVFRRKFLAALTRQMKWTAGDALDFQSDLQMYEELIARANSTRRTRKPFEAANHPFVDRCAFVLDSSFMEKARLASSRALTDIENLGATIVAEELQKHGAK